MTRLTRLLTMVLLLPVTPWPTGACEPDMCRELRRLNANFIRLWSQYEAEIQKQQGLPQNLGDEIRSVATQHGRIVYRLLRDAEARHAGDEIMCCRQQETDLIIQWVCAVAVYLQNQERSILIQGMPTGRTGTEALWRTDQILGLFQAGADAAETPRALRGRSFASLVIQVIYQQAASGDSIAMEGFLTMMLYADGGYAEELEEWFAQLLTENPKVVLSHWPTIRKFQERIHLQTTGYAESAKDTIEKYKHECEAAVHKPIACDEVLPWLARLATER